MDLKSKCFLLLLTQLLLTGGTWGRASSPPNVVIIIADDLNDFAYHKNFPIARTPHLDAFRKSAVTFYNAYCAAPVCEPSRASVFSGLYPHSTGSYLNGSDPWRKAPLNTVEALPELFKRSGYTTFGRGKLFHAKLDEGREEGMWDNRPLYGGGFGPFPKEEDQIEGNFWGVTPWKGPDSDFPDVVNVDAAIDFLQASHEVPFFMVVGLWRPHTPYTAPERFFKLYNPAEIPIPLPGFSADDLSDVPPYGHYLSSIWGSRFEVSGIDTPEAWRRIVHGYLACSSFADWSIGRIVNTVDATGLRENTLVIVWSDNGYHLGEKSHFEKNTVWEKSAMTPLVIRLPGEENAGALVKSPVGSIDIFPTLVDYCGLQDPSHTLDGKSLRPLLENQEASLGRPAFTIYGQGVFSARDERYRYIQYPDGMAELYDLWEDPFEFHNRINDPTVTDIKKRLAQWYPEDWAFSLGGRNYGTNRAHR